MGQRSGDAEGQGANLKPFRAKSRRGFIAHEDTKTQRSLDAPQALRIHLVPEFRERLRRIFVSSCLRMNHSSSRLRVSRKSG
jgi:hypothetical protein